MKDKVWIKFYSGGTLNEELTFSEAEKRIDIELKMLQSHGLRPGDRVLVILPNSIRAIVIYFALLRMGLIAVPMNPGDFSGRLDYVKQHSMPKAIVDSEGVVVLDDMSVDDFQNSQNISTIIYTSGTTGNPKGVCLGLANWKSNAQALIQHHNLDSDSILATPLPLFHCNAHGFGMFTSYFSRSTLILFDKINESFLDVINKERVQVASLVPAVLHKLYESSPDWEPHRQFRYFLTAAAPLSGSLLSQIRQAWRVQVIQGYGLSESTNFSCTLPVDLDDRNYQSIMLPNPSVGIALPGVTLRIGENDKEGVIGQVFVTSSSNFLGYWRESIAPRNVVATGDLGYFKIREGRRFYYLVGREKEFINRGGEKLNPMMIEAELRSLGISQEICVVGIPDKTFGEEPALVVTRPIEFSLLEKIPKYRRPKKVFLSDRFFFTATGKLQRILLAQYCVEPSNNVAIIWTQKL